MNLQQLPGWLLDILLQNQKRETGLEPATNGLEGRNSTIELLPHGQLYSAIAESQHKMKECNLVDNPHEFHRINTVMISIFAPEQHISHTQLLSNSTRPEFNPVRTALRFKQEE
jgi:hypothetical protein